MSRHEDEPSGWQAVAASNRERITALEHEVDRLRDRHHQLQGEVAVIRYLADKIGDLGEDVKELTQEVEQIARRALSRPPAALVGQYIGLVVAVVALIVAATR